MDEQHLKQLSIPQLRDWLRVDEKLLDERARVMNAIPECPRHGHQCVEHAVKWIINIEIQRSAMLNALKNTRENISMMILEGILEYYDFSEIDAAIIRAEEG